MQIHSQNTEGLDCLSCRELSPQDERELPDLFFASQGCVCVCVLECTYTESKQFGVSQERKPSYPPFHLQANSRKVANVLP